MVYTIKQFLEYKNICYCGTPLSVTFNYSYAKYDVPICHFHMKQIVSIKYNGKYTVTASLDKRHAIFDDFTIFSFLLNVPNEKIDIKFEIIADHSNNSIRIVINSIVGHITKNYARELVKKYFIEELQKNLNITYIKTCPNKECKSSFKISSSKILFDLEKCTLSNFYTSNENLEIIDNDYIYRFTTSYEDNTTHLEYKHKNKNNFMQKIDMNMDQYTKYPMNRDFLFKKIKTLLLFS
jgi:hypothetical protein